MVAAVSFGGCNVLAMVAAKMLAPSVSVGTGAKHQQFYWRQTLLLLNSNTALINCCCCWRFRGGVGGNIVGSSKQRQCSQ